MPTSALPSSASFFDTVILSERRDLRTAVLCAASGNTRILPPQQALLKQLPGLYIKMPVKIQQKINGDIRAIAPLQ